MMSSIGRNGDLLKIFYSDTFPIPLPSDHRFPGDKYRLLRQQIQKEHLVPDRDLLVPEPASDADILLVHHRDYLERVINGSLSEKEIRRLGFPWSPQLVERSRRSVGGTIEACRTALNDSTGVNLAGGTHHAHPGYGSGYCMLNDCAIAARVMQKEGLANRVVILDCDVHQGDGTAAIFSNDASVFTFSIHGLNNFPFHKEASDLDLALEDGISDREYLQALEMGLEETFSRFEADLAIYLAGADLYHGDRLGRLALTKDGIAARDELVFKYCQQKGLRTAVVMAGGYAREIIDSVDIHLNTVRTAVKTADSFQTMTHAQ
jgi:acetoin utilization deacetylase AcuC-like enzyme